MIHLVLVTACVKPLAAVDCSEMLMLICSIWGLWLWIWENINHWAFDVDIKTGLETNCSNSFIAIEHGIQVEEGMDNIEHL